MPYGFTLNTDVSAISAKLIRLAGLNRDTATVDEMDEKDPRFVHPDFLTEVGYPVFTWRASVCRLMVRLQWKVFGIGEIFRLATAEEEAQIKERERSLRESAKAWTCNHCIESLDATNTGTKPVILEHLLSAHNIEEPKMPEDYFVNERCRYKYEYPAEIALPNRTAELFKCKCWKCRFEIAEKRVFTEEGLAEHFKWIHVTQPPSTFSAHQFILRACPYVLPETDFESIFCSFADFPPFCLPQESTNPALNLHPSSPYGAYPAWICTVVGMQAATSHRFALEEAFSQIRRDSLVLASDSTCLRTQIYMDKRSARQYFSIGLTSRGRTPWFISAFHQDLKEVFRDIFGLCVDLAQDELTPDALSQATWEEYKGGSVGGVVRWVPHCIALSISTNHYLTPATKPFTAMRIQARLVYQIWYRRKFDEHAVHTPDWARVPLVKIIQARWHHADPAEKQDWRNATNLYVMALTAEGVDWFDHTSIVLRMEEDGWKPRREWDFEGAYVGAGDVVRIAPPWSNP
ncbi:hypothetical protein NMY22_g15306 [Coprinellus aureogranulatus]|nr:hypothetical protein NMY22_g15306 [Coprinellus aureogranulatus]